jgi:hypothetical protein
MPMVSITIEKAGWPRMGRMTARSAAKPNRAIAGTADSTASQNGQPSMVISARPQEGAQHHQFALREAHRLGGLVDEHEAQRDEAVDAALCDTADDELQNLQSDP